jgi:tetratricopeptide (TPR) repeat protein
LILQLWAITVKPFRLTIGPLRSIPQYAEAWRNKGNALLDYQGELNEAIRCFDEAIRLNPDLPDAWYNKGNALDQHGKYDEAIKALGEAIGARLRQQSHFQRFKGICH